MKLSEVRDVLKCTVLAGEESLDTEVEMVVASDGMSDVLASPHSGSLMVTGLTNIQSVRTAYVAYLPAIVYVRGKHPMDKAIDLAREKKVVLMATELGMFDACGMLRERGLKGAM